MTYAYESRHDDDSVLCMGISFEQNRIWGNLKLKGKEQQKSTFVAYTLNPTILDHAGILWCNKLHPISNESKV